MRADQAVRGVAADEEAASEQPEVARPDGRGERGPSRVVGALGGRDGRAFPIRARAYVLRAVAHEQEHRHRDRDARDDHQGEAGTPAVAHGERHHRGHEDELTRGRRRPERADDEAAVAAEPAVRHGGAGHLAGDAGADADEDPPEQVELPEVAQREQEVETEGDHAEAAEERPARTDPVDERATDRAAEPEGDETDRDREGDRRAVPAELAFERRDEDARRRADGGRGEERDERDGSDDPRVVETGEHAQSLRSRRVFSR